MNGTFGILDLLATYWSMSMEVHFVIDLSHLCEHDINDTSDEMYNVQQEIKRRNKKRNIFEMWSWPGLRLSCLRENLNVLDSTWKEVNGQKHLFALFILGNSSMESP